MNPTLQYIAVVSMSVACCSCVAKRVAKNLASHYEDEKGRYRALAGQLRDDDTRPISWEVAYKRLLADNLTLRQSINQLEMAKRQGGAQWRSLIPRVGSYVNIGASIAELTDLTSDDLNARLIASFNIPNPFNFYAALYAAELQRQNAEWSHDLDKRRAYGQLYGAFIEARSIRDAEELVARQQSMLTTVSKSTEIVQQLDQLKRQMESLDRRRQYLRLNLNQLFNTPGASWMPSGELPDISFRDRINQLEIGEQFGKLALNLQAARIEGAMLQYERVKFRQWPTLNFAVSTPPVYASEGNNDFSGDELLLFTGASKQIDLTDIAGLQEFEDAETRLQFTRDRLRLTAEREVSRFESLATNYRKLLDEERAHIRKLKRMAAMPGSSESELVIRQISLYAEQQGLLIEVRRRIQQLDLQFLIWDETFW